MGDDLDARRKDIERYLTGGYIPVFVWHALDDFEREVRLLREVARTAKKSYLDEAAACQAITAYEAEFPNTL